MSIVTYSDSVFVFSVWNDQDNEDDYICDMAVGYDESRKLYTISFSSTRRVTITEDYKEVERIMLLEMFDGFFDAFCNNNIVCIEDKDYKKPKNLPFQEMSLIKTGTYERTMLDINANPNSDLYKKSEKLKLIFDNVNSATPFAVEKRFFVEEEK